jgi:hypothetical protein
MRVSHVALVLSALTHRATLPLGERKSLAKLKKMAQDDVELQPKNLSDERKKELIDNLMEARAEKQTNARSSNRAAARDVQATIDRVTSEVNPHTFDYSTRD